jgi:hypothetical protein
MVRVVTRVKRIGPVLEQFSYFQNFHTRITERIDEWMDGWMDESSSSSSSFILFNPKHNPSSQTSSKHPLHQKQQQKISYTKS